jgi:hypothetical protein
MLCFLTRNLSLAREDIGIIPGPYGVVLTSVAFGGAVIVMFGAV